MYKINKRGHDIDPWGTPCAMLPVSDVVLLCQKHILFTILKETFKPFINITS